MDAGRRLGDRIHANRPRWRFFLNGPTLLVLYIQYTIDDIRGNRTAPHSVYLLHTSH
jgi:hypothetical protein